MILAVDDGLFSGNADFADICYLIAVILFVIAALFQYRIPDRVYGGAITSVGLAAISLGLLVS
jgi:hypothetical protein